MNPVSCEESNPELHECHMGSLWTLGKTGPRPLEGNDTTLRSPEGALLTSEVEVPKRVACCGQFRFRLGD